MARLHLSVFAACAAALALAAPTLADHDMLQDFCVADLASPITLNGFPCKPAANTTAEDFFFAGLKKQSGGPPTRRSNPEGSVVAVANVATFPGVNTLGVSMARIDHAPGGLDPPHTHPRATEIAFVLEGTLEVGFISTANKLFIKNITKGEVFVFPRGLLHYQKNRGHGPATVISGYNGIWVRGTQAAATALFAADPPVPSDVLAKSLRTTIAQVDAIKAKFK